MMNTPSTISNDRGLHSVAQNASQGIESSSLVPHVKTAISRGFHVFPLAPNSKVTVPGSHGFKDSKPPSDPSALAPWHQEPSFNIGIDLGASDLCVLDFDDPSSLLKKSLQDEIFLLEISYRSGSRGFFVPD
jgi:hypothetical protein